jgi:hypothetical protein
MKPALEVILKRAHALRTLSHRGSPHEAEAAALALDRMIARYQLREEQIEAAGDRPTTEVVLSSEPAYSYTKRQPWRSALLHVLAAHYGVVCFRRQLPKERGKKRREDTLLAGRPDDIEIVRALFAWLSVDIARLGLSETKGQGPLGASSWRLGFVYGIKDQLQRARRGGAEDSRALVRISDERQDAALRHVQRLVKELTKEDVGRSSLEFGMQRVDAHLAGRARGRETHLGARLAAGQGADDPPSGSQVS